MLGFADVNWVIRFNANKDALKEEMEVSLQTISRWLKMSGMKVNEEKTECCLFYKHDQEVMSLRIGDRDVKSKKQMNVLGYYSIHVCCGNHKLTTR